jgi:hypothetical protein
MSALGSKAVAPNSRLSVVRDFETVFGLNYWRLWLIRVSV